MAKKVIRPSSKQQIPTTSISRTGAKVPGLMLPNEKSVVTGNLLTSKKEPMPQNIDSSKPSMGNSGNVSAYKPDAGLSALVKNMKKSASPAGKKK